MQFSERTKTDASLAITPIVDTVFNLLIFFALSLNFIITPGIQVRLPDAVTEEIIREREEVIIVMGRDGGVFVNNNPVSIDGIASVLTKSARNNKDTLVIIQADREVFHGNVVRVMDTAKRAGFTRLAIATSTTKQAVLEKSRR